MIVLELIENTFSKKTTLTYELSILIGMDSLCYLINDRERHIQVLKRYHFKSVNNPHGSWAKALEHLLHTEPLLQLPYSRTNLGILHNRLALVPNRLFNELHKRSYLEALFQLERSEWIYADRLRAEPVQVVYALDKQVTEVLRQYFPGAPVFHGISGMIQSFKKIAETFRGFRLFLNIRNGYFQAFLFDKGHLVFYNTFKFESSRDFIYFVLLILDQHQLNSDTVQVFYSGNLLEDSEIYNLLKRYLYYLKKVPVLGMYEFGSEIEQQQLKYRFMDLFSMLYCF